MTQVVRSRRQPYVVFYILIVPAIALNIYATLYSGDQKGWLLVGGTCLMLALIHYFLWRRRLVLEDGYIAYGEMWRTRKFALHAIKSIDLDHWMYGSRPWIILLNDSSLPITINVATFEPAKLKKFAEEVHKAEPSIRISVFSI